MVRVVDGALSVSIEVRGGASTSRYRFTESSWVVHLDHSSRCSITGRSVTPSLLNILTCVRFLRQGVEIFLLNFFSSSKCFPRPTCLTCLRTRHSIVGERIFWKIDYYADEAMEFGADEPADPNRSFRVMTIMLAAEY